MSTELATAYLSLVPSMKGAEGKITAELAGVGATAGEKASGGFLSKMGGLVTGTAKFTGAAVGVVGGLIAGIAAKGGIDRALNIEDAKAKLTGLGHSTETVTGIMGNATAAVKGTAFGLGEAATTAAGAVAAGIQPGERLQNVLRLVADSATIAGTDMASMGSIFNKVAASNKLQGDSIAQLQDAGVPVLQFVAKEMGVTAEEAAKMASEGKISFDTFAAAMESGLGGAALASGNTFRGALKNVYAALGRVGETTLAPFLRTATMAFGAAIPLIDDVNAALKPVMASVEGWLQARAPGMIQAFSDGVRSGMATGTQAITAFVNAWKYNDGEVTSSGLPGFMERVGYIARQTFDFARGAVLAFTAAWRYNDGEVTSSGFNGFMERVGYIARQTFDTAIQSVTAFVNAWKYNDGEVTSSGLPGFMERVGYLARQGMDRAVEGVRAFTAAWQYNDGEVTSSGFSGFMERAGFYARQGFEWAKTAVLGFIDAFGQLDFSSWDGFTASLGGAGSTVGGAFSSIGVSIQALMPAVREFIAQVPQMAAALPELARGAGELAAFGIQVLAGALSFLSQHVDTIIAWMPAIVAGFIAWRVASMALQGNMLALQWAQVAMAPVLLTNNTLRLIAIRLEGQQAAATAANTAATTAQTGAQNVGILANLRAAAAWVGHTAALAAHKVAAGVSAAAQWALNAAMSANPIALIVIAIAALVGALIWFFTQTELGQQIFSAVWAGIQAVAQATADWFMGTFLPWISGVWNGISAGFQWLGGIISTIFQTYVAITVAVWTTIINTIMNVVNGVRNFVSSGFQAVWSVTSSIWNNIVGFIGSIPGRIMAGLAFLASLGAAAAGWFGGVLNSGRNKLGELVGFVGGIPGRILSALGNLGSLLYSAGRDVVNGMINGIRDMVGNLAETAANMAKSALDAAKNFLGIKSPSRKLRFEVGQMMGEGAALGIEDKAGRVQDALAKMVTPPEVPTFARGTFAASYSAASDYPALYGGSSSGSNIPPLTIEGDVYGAIPEEIVDEINTTWRRGAVTHNLQAIGAGAGL